MSEASLARDGEQVRQIVTHLASQPGLAKFDLENALDLLEHFECWQPYFSLLDRILSDRKVRSLAFYVRKARAQNLLIEDVFAAAETCMDAVVAMKLSYADFQYQVVPRVIVNDDWASEAVILQALVDKFPSVSDRIKGWERLCLLFEKKVHNEEKLADCYERLQQLDQFNIKALRYFKMVFSQSSAWSQVAGVLKKLLQVSQHPQDVYRTAQELAAVELYQLDKPKDALDLLQRHCRDSPLDTSMIKFDAYFRMDDLKGCLKVLEECLENTHESERRAILFYKAGLLHEQLNNSQEAARDYQKAVSESSEFLEPIERLVHLAVEQKDWHGLEQRLRMLKDAVIQKPHREQLQEALSRLQEGLSGRVT